MLGWSKYNTYGLEKVASAASTLYMLEVYMSTIYHSNYSSLSLTQCSGCSRNPLKKVRQEAKRLLYSIQLEVQDRVL